MRDDDPQGRRRGSAEDDPWKLIDDYRNRKFNLQPGFSFGIPYPGWRGTVAFVGLVAVLTVVVLLMSNC